MITRTLAYLILATITISSCKSPAVTTGSTMSPATETVETRTVTVGDPQNNSAVALIIGSDVGGDEGVYISKQMDIQATDMGKTELKGVKILRVGEGIKVTFDGSLMFKKNSASLSDQSKKNLDQLAETLAKYNNTRLIIEGHTDGTGSTLSNKVLSEKRAGEVASYLATRKVDRKRIKISGYGETQPLFANNTEQGRRQNRRVELIILADDQLRSEAKSKSASRE